MRPEQHGLPPWPPPCGKPMTRLDALLENITLSDSLEKRRALAGRVLRETMPKNLHEIEAWGMRLIDAVTAPMRAKAKKKRRWFRR